MEVVALENQLPWVKGPLMEDPRKNALSIIGV